MTAPAFLPSDRSPAAIFKPIIRALAVELVCRANSSTNRQQAASQLFGEAEAERITKAPVSPMTLAGSPLAGSGVSAFLGYLRPQSAAARLFELAPRVSLDGMATITLPRWSTAFAEPPWVGEGEPIRVVQGVAESVVLGPVRKLAAISTITSELDDMTGGVAELIVSTALRDAASRALDSAVFGDLAANATRPAGLRNGIAALPATTGGNINAIATDIGNLVGALSAAGAGSDVIFIASPKQASTIRIFSPGFEVISAPSLPAGVVIAVEREGIASAFDGVPSVDIARDSTLHMEDTAPLQLVSGVQGSGVLASPSRSLFQTSTFGVRCILRVAFAKRFPGAVQWISGATW